VREGADYLTVAGTDAIKIWYLRSADPSAAAQQREHLELAGNWARQAGIPLIVHATGLEGAREAVRAGAHLLVHSVEDREVDDNFVRLAARSGVFYNPTLSVYEGYQELRERRFDEDRTDIRCVDPQTLALIRSTRELPGGLSPEAVERSRSSAAARDRRTASNLRAMHAGGVPVVVGTDAGNPLTLHGPAIFREMEAMQEAGLTPMQVLVAATLNGARVLGLEALIGSIEEGKAADLVVLGSDPLSDISNVRQIRWVMREGTLMARDELQFTHPIRPDAPGANPFR
jgi:imidazolonepropionase-like amidohydrolase